MRVGRVMHFSLFNDAGFAELEALTMLVNNQINIFLVNPNIILYYPELSNIHEY